MAAAVTINIPSNRNVAPRRGIFSIHQHQWNALPDAVRFTNLEIMVYSPHDVVFDRQAVFIWLAVDDDGELRTDSTDGIEFDQLYGTTAVKDEVFAVYMELKALAEEFAQRPGFNGFTKDDIVAFNEEVFATVL